LARGLVDLGLDITVVTYTDQFETHETVHGVKIHRLPCPNIYWSFQSRHQPSWKKVLWHVGQSSWWRPGRVVRQVIADLRPDIVHSSTIEDFGVGFWRFCQRAGIPCVHTLRSFNLLHYTGTLYDAQHDCEIRPDWLAVARKRCAEHLSGVVGISHSILEKHVQAGFFRGVTRQVIGNPVEIPIQRETRARSGPIRLGVLGRVSPEKGILQALDCLRRMGDTSHWSLIIGGTGPESYVEEVKKAAQGLPVEFPGWVESQSFLEGLDLLIVPSRWDEPFGRIVIESHAVGVPVVCLRRGGLPELIDHGQTGWIFDDWDTNRLREAIGQCRGVDRRRLIAAAEPFSVASIASQYHAFYQRLVVG
jgi:glycosyltransferase involved in cell wall biosynthesis